MVIEYGSPFRGERLKKLRMFLRAGGLEYDEGVQFTVLFLEDGRIAATGSLEENVIKCVMVEPERRGEDLSSSLLTLLVSEAFRRGRTHLFLFTKPENEEMFTRQGFYRVAGTGRAILLENRKNGIQDFVNGLERPKRNGTIGCVVCNCNPLTNGHLFLIRTAARQCALLHVFILSEDRSVFPADVRFGLVKSGVASLRNTVVHPTSDYLISSATFPAYFYKDKSAANAGNFELDFTIFRRHFAETLGISCRYIGSEPYSAVMSAYNEEMKKFFWDSGIKIIEIPRRTLRGTAISASQVRQLLGQGDLASVRELVPPVTFRFLQSPRGGEIIRKIKQGGYP